MLIHSCVKMEKTDIKNREDIYNLVTFFYEKVREDNTLKAVFNASIKDWDAHLQLITNFWETSLLAKKTYKGDPFIVHQKVDEKMNYKITMVHFGAWLNLWFETVDAHFEGKIANMAKRRAQKMASFMFIKVFEARK